MKRDEALDIILATKVIAVIRMRDRGQARSCGRGDPAGRGDGDRNHDDRCPGRSTSSGDGRGEAGRRPHRRGDGLGRGDGDGGHPGRGGFRRLSRLGSRGRSGSAAGRDTFVAPGAFTPTEILAAWRSGADVVKVFPATRRRARNFSRTSKGRSRISG